MPRTIRLVPRLDGLESRRLLSGAVAHPVAQVHALRLSLPTIRGTIQGTVTSVAPINATTEVVAYTAQGKANIIGDGRGGGQHTLASKVVKKHPTNDTYTNGLATVTGTTDTVEYHFSGTGHTKADGSFTATLHGRATSVGGLHAGLSGTITAQLSGNHRTGAFVITFSIKL